VAIVVSDTSPVRALHHLGRIKLLEDLFGHVLVPPEVAEELRRTGRRFGPIELAHFPFLTIESPQDQARVQQLEASLDSGEAAAIVLALECRADYILIDERFGRRLARESGLTVVGALGVLLLAKRRGLIPQLRPLIMRLQGELDFYLSPGLVAGVLRDANE